MRELEETFDVPVIEAYGMTEAAHQITSNSLPPGKRKPRSVGLPVGTEVAVVDDDGRPVLCGETGEIIVRGVNVACGYVNGSQADQDCFRDGWFRTGDLGYVDQDGYLFLTGRLKEIINRGGEKVAPRELDEVLLEHEAVAQAVSFAIPHPALGEDVAAAVILKGDYSATPKQLRDFAMSRLAPFKVPSQVFVTDQIPFGASGKVNRRKISEHFRLQKRQVQDNGESSQSTPFSAVETALSTIWMEVLGVPRVHIRDNFFELGGHSLLATRVVSRVRDRFDVELAVTALFDHPTIEELAPLIERVEQTTSYRAARAGVTPASFAQQRLWFLHELEPSSSAYNMSEAFRLKGKLDIGALERSLAEIARRHEILRTTFTFMDGQLIQVIADDKPFRLRLDDLTTVPQAVRDKTARRILAEEARRPFDLRDGPLLRARLLRTGEEDYVFLCTMHHIVSDAWSMNIFFRELSTLYGAYSTGGSCTLPELPIQYADFAQWQRNWFQGDILRRQLDYWKNSLKTHHHNSCFLRIDRGLQSRVSVAQANA